MGRRVFAAWGAALLSFCLSQSARAAVPEPWSDSDPPDPPTRHAFGDYGVRAGAEYRANALVIKPLSLNTENNRNAAWIEHRLRLDGTADYLDKVRITTSVDALESVVWGDNGDLGKAPEPSSGANVNTKNVNSGRVCVQYNQVGNPLEASSYAYGICPGDPIYVRRLYGDVLLPIGLLRVGRQAFTEGTAVGVADGDGRRNRFGFAYRGNNVDRILFATKPLEAFKAKFERDTSLDRGVFLVLAYDKLVNDRPQLLSDNLHQWITAIRYLEPNLGVLRDVEGRVFHVHRWDRTNDTAVHAMGSRLTYRLADFYAGFDVIGILGKTREVANAFRVITNDPAVDQPIRQFGARAVARYDRPAWTAYMEFDYASGDADPQVRTPLTQITWAEDTNVGLLLFKHVLAYQTARAAAAASELLRSLNAPTIPAESIATGGAFTNAMALFPQFDVRPARNLLLRGGALFAWAPAPVIDPVRSQQRRDGNVIDDDLVNFVGGKPGQYYGTELDARVQYRFMDHFIFDLEGAILFPGSALEDEDGYAARSGMVQGRTTFFF